MVLWQRDQPLDGLIVDELLTEDATGEAYLLQ
jgi:hypothetical protein